jgi:prevent-host-death family protein
MVTSVIIVTMSPSPSSKPRRSSTPAAPVDEAVAAGVFKAKCLALLDDVELHGATFVVTKRGRPVARLVPLSKTERGSLRGSLLHEEDLVAPVGAVWKERF